MLLNSASDRVPGRHFGHAGPGSTTSRQPAFMIIATSRMNAHIHQESRV
jgi:hypothetical protein